jgi:hypothetical protein
MRRRRARASLSIPGRAKQSPATHTGVPDGPQGDEQEQVGERQGEEQDREEEEAGQGLEG